MNKKTEILENFTQNIERERISLGYTQAQMAEKLGMSTSGYKKMISGETGKIDLYLAWVMYDLCGKFLCELCGNPVKEVQFIRKYEHLSEAQRRFVRGVLDFEAAFATEQGKGEDFVTVMEPTGNFEDAMIWDSVNLTKTDVSAYRGKFGAEIDCGIKITSNHMHPIYHIGDILLVSQTAPRDGDTGIFVNRETGRAYIRKFRQTNPCRLESLTGYGQPILIDSFDADEMNKWIKFGRVLAKMRE